jgi:hypothetical protein
VAVVSYAGDQQQQEVVRSTVGSFLQDVDYKKLPPELNTFFVGKFLKVGQARNDGVASGKDFIQLHHDPSPGVPE